MITDYKERSLTSVKLSKGVTHITKNVLLHWKSLAEGSLNLMQYHTSKRPDLDSRGGTIAIEEYNRSEVNPVRSLYLRGAVVASMWAMPLR